MNSVTVHGYIILFLEIQSKFRFMKKILNFASKFKIVQFY